MKSIMAIGSRKVLTRIKFELYFNRMQKLLAITLAFFLFVPPAMFADPLEPFAQVHQSTANDGDTITTSQVAAACTTGCLGPPILLSASVTGTSTGNNKTNRRRTICNASSFVLYIGTQTAAATLNSTGFRISESTGTSPCWSTYNTAAIYGQTVGASSGTVTVIQESNAVQ